jgi:lipid-A-disaccharide synthase
MKALIVAGEASGDIYGAGLASVLRNRIPDLQIAGMGGERMQQSGVELVAHYRSVAVVGVFEVLSKLTSLMKSFNLLTRWIEVNSPDFVVLIDFPDFNFRLARFLKKKGIRVFYFISPQIWAWRKERIHFLKDHVTLMITILPFEKMMYDQAGVPSVYIGHPLVEIVRNELLAQKPLKAGKSRILGLMAGSRDTEVKRHLPVLLNAAKRLQEKIPIEPVLIWAPSLNEKEYNIPSGVRIVKEDRYAAMQSADFLFVASGTSTLECAIVGSPFLIVYRVGALSWQLGKILVRVPFYGLVNWIAQEKIVPEFIQNRMTPELLAEEAAKYLGTEPLRNALKRNLAKVVELLGPPGAMERAADAIMKCLAQSVTL